MCPAAELGILIEEKTLLDTCELTFNCREPLKVSKDKQEVKLCEKQVVGLTRRALVK